MQEVRVITKTSQDANVIQLRPDVQAPQTRQEFEALHHRRGELNNQIEALRKRRNQLDEQRHVSSAEQRPLIMARIEETDARIARLEGDLDMVNDQIAAAPAHLLTVAETRVERGPGDRLLSELASEIVPITAIVSVFFLGPLALGVLRLMWKRSNAPPRPAIADQMVVQRLEQLQQSVDAMAIEVERISEGQRFVSKLMNEREPQLLGARPDAAAKR